MADSPKINSTGTLVDALVTEVADEQAILLEGSTPEKDSEDPFVTVTDPMMLEQNKEAIENALDGGTFGDAVGASEENAFLTAFSNAYSRGTQSRSARFLAAHRRFLGSIDPTGVLNKQLRGIGTKVDPNFITQIVEESDEE